MVAKSKTTAGKGSAKKLKLERETLKDLDLKRQAMNVKGGLAPTRAVGDCTGSNRISC